MSRWDTSLIDPRLATEEFAEIKEECDSAASTTKQPSLAPMEIIEATEEEDMSAPSVEQPSLSNEKYEALRYDQHQLIPTYPAYHALSQHEQRFAPYYAQPQYEHASGNQQNEGYSGVPRLFEWHKFQDLGDDKHRDARMPTFSFEQSQQEQVSGDLQGYVSKKTTSRPRKRKRGLHPTLEAPAATESLESKQMADGPATPNGYVKYGPFYVKQNIVDDPELHEHGIACMALAIYCARFAALDDANRGVYEKCLKHYQDELEKLDKADPAAKKSKSKR